MYYGTNNKDFLFIKYKNHLTFVKIYEKEIEMEIDESKIQMNCENSNILFENLHESYKNENYSIKFSKDELKEFQYQHVVIENTTPSMKADGFYDIFF